MRTKQTQESVQKLQRRAGTRQVKARRDESMHPQRTSAGQPWSGVQTTSAGGRSGRKRSGLFTTTAAWTRTRGSTASEWRLPAGEDLLPSNVTTGHRKNFLRERESDSREPRGAGARPPTRCAEVAGGRTRDMLPYGHI